MACTLTAALAARRSLFEQMGRLAAFVMAISCALIDTHCWLRILLIETTIIKSLNLRLEIRLHLFICHLNIHVAVLLRHVLKRLMSAILAVLTRLNRRGGHELAHRMALELIGLSWCHFVLRRPLLQSCCSSLKLLCIHCVVLLQESCLVTPLFTYHCVIWQTCKWQCRTFSLHNLCLLLKFRFRPIFHQIVAKASQLRLLERINDLAEANVSTVVVLRSWRRWRPLLRDC